jgi:hypothetical protein
MVAFAIAEQRIIYSKKDKNVDDVNYNSSGRTKILL